MLCSSPSVTSVRLLQRTPGHEGTGEVTSSTAGGVSQANSGKHSQLCREPENALVVLSVRFFPRGKTWVSSRTTVLECSEMGSGAPGCTPTPQGWLPLLPSPRMAALLALSPPHHWFPVTNPAVLIGTLMQERGCWSQFL